MHNINFFRKTLIYVSLISLLIISFQSTILAKPSLSYLEKKHHKAVEDVFFWSSITDAMGVKSLITDVALYAYRDYKRTSLSDDYTLQDFKDEIKIIGKIYFHTADKRVTIPMKVIAWRQHISASYNLKNVEKELKKYYPVEARKILGEVGNVSSSSGGGAGRSW